jgi:uncharacterized integral membrane protein (TIGR00698 family)
MDSDKLKSLFIKMAFVLVLAFCLSSLINGPVALIAGFLFANLFGHPFIHLNKQAVNYMLKFAVIGIGFGMNIEEALKAGSDGFTLTIVSIAITLILGYVIGRLFHIEKKITHLISTGTAICGGSAIAAVSPIIDASEKEMSISLGVVFLLNSAALLIFPGIGHLLGLTEYQFGMWSAVAIHDTSSVVGAAQTFGDHALQTATTIKMSRVVWIIPISILSMFLFKGKNKSIKIPWFILLFVAAILLNSYGYVDLGISETITGISKRVLVLTLFLIGAGLSIEKIKAAGWKPMLLGLSLWVMISVLTLMYISFS